MAVLLLRLCGPMQSWGTQSRFSNRDTEIEPSKSGIIGLLCAALGITRNDESSLKRLAELKMGVRVDKEGVIKRDYHTAGKGGYLRATGGIERKYLIVSNRYFLADACFLVALQGSIGLLQEIDTALEKPTWQLYLGRKAFVPSLSVKLKKGLRLEQQDLKEALTNYPYLCSIESSKGMEYRLRLELEVGYGQGQRIKHDQPLSFLSNNRQFGLRHVVTDWIEIKLLPNDEEEELCFFHA
jgi:CRISPR system Cascade subunit CasD